MLICPKCGTVHRPDKCQAHSLRQGGGQCGSAPVHGLTTCFHHGGASPQALQIRDERTAINQAVAAASVAAIRRPSRIPPVTNPLLELQELAGEAKWWKQVMSDHVEQLRSLRYGTDGGEAIRGEIILFERAMDRCLAILIAIAKLEIDERLVRIEAQKRDMILTAIDAGLTAAGLTGPAAADARAATSARLRVLATHMPLAIDAA